MIESHGRVSISAHFYRVANIGLNSWNAELHVWGNVCTVFIICSL